MFVYMYICYLKIVQKHFSNLINLGVVYIFLYQQLESGKCLFDTFFTIKKIWPGIQKYQLLKPLKGSNPWSRVPGFSSNSAVFYSKNHPEITNSRNTL